MQDTTTETVGFRLSPQQEQLLSQGGGPGAVQCAALLAGPIEDDQLRAALIAAASRHEILRTTFVRPAGIRATQQVIADDLAVTWSAPGSAPGLGEAGALAGILALEAGIEFDLERGPLLRATLYGSGGEDRLLVVTASALCADLASLILLLDQTGECYRGAAPGEGEDPIQYADYAEWRHELIAGETADAEPGRAFWRDDAADRPQAPRILFGARAPVLSGRCRSAPVDLSGVPLAELERVASAAGASLPVILEAAWHALLARVSGASDTLTAAWLAGRGQPELEHAVGPYAQPASIRTRLAEGTSFAELVDQVRRASAATERWHDYAADDDLAAVISGAAAGFRHVALPPVQAPVREILALTTTRAAAPLVLDSSAGEESLRVELSYDPAAFATADAEELAARFAIVLASALQDPGQPVSRLALLDGAEPAAIVLAAAGPEPPADGATPVHRRFEAQAALTPDRLAVDSAGGRMTYAELNAAANRLAHHLRAAGVAPGDVVGLCMERTPSMLAALLAILKAGAAYLPLNFEHPRARLAHQLSESGARAVVSEQELADRVPDFDGELVLVDADRERIAAHPATNPDRAPELERLVYVMYTSGSTGSPKGVAVTHRNLSTYVAAILARLGLDDGEGPQGLRYGVVSAISTDLGNTTLFPPLVSGGCVQLISAAASMDGDAFASELAGARLDVLKITPSHLRALLGAESLAVLPRRWLVLGGEALPWDLVAAVAERAPGCRVLNHYGPTETTVGCCTYVVDGDRRADSDTVPIGYPLAGARAYVLDPHLEPAPAGVPGELCIAGAGVASGYVGGGGTSRFTGDPFVPGGAEPMYRTGDRARRLRDGAIEFLGRTDDQVKIRGFRVEPGEVEAVLLAHPAVREAAVTAEEDGTGALGLVAYIAARDVPPVEELEEFLAASLPHYMVPSRFATVETLPLTPSGKVDRRALTALAEAHARQAAEYLAPRDEIEAQIAEIWRELLGVERVGVLDDFFALGGHSLLATQAIMRIRRQHGDIPLRALLAAPTVAALADVVRAAGR